MSHQTASGDERVGARNLERVDGTIEGPAGAAPDAHPRGVAVVAAVPGRRDPFRLSRKRLADGLAIARTHEVEQLLHLVRPSDLNPIVVARRLRGTPDLQPSGYAEVAEQPQDPVSQAWTGSAVIEHDAGTAVHLAPGAVAAPHAGEQRPLLGQGPLPDQVRHPLVVGVAAYAERVAQPAGEDPRGHADARGGAVVLDRCLHAVARPEV